MDWREENREHRGTRCTIPAIRRMKFRPRAAFTRNLGTSFGSKHRAEEAGASSRDLVANVSRSVVTDSTINTASYVSPSDGPALREAHATFTTMQRVKIPSTVRLARSSFGNRNREVTVARMENTDPNRRWNFASGASGLRRSTGSAIA